MRICRLSVNRFSSRLSSAMSAFATRHLSKAALAPAVSIALVSPRPAGYRIAWSVSYRSTWLGRLKSTIVWGCDPGRTSRINSLRTLYCAGSNSSTTSTMGLSAVLYIFFWPIIFGAEHSTRIVPTGTLAVNSPAIMLADAVCEDPSTGTNLTTPSFSFTPSSVTVPWMVP